MLGAMFFVPAAFALDVTHVRLAGSIDVAGKRLDGVATLETAPREGPVRLDAEGLQITGVTVGGRRVPFNHRDGFLELDAPGVAPIVVTYTAGPSGGLRFEGEFASTQYATWTWLPCPSDPSDRATFDVDLRVPDGSVLVADGDGEAPAYTWGFAVGPYERHADGVSVVYTPRGVPVPEHAFRDTAAVLAKAAELTGVPYANRHYVTVLTPYSSAQEV
ncbi:MAG: hypothetical protein KC656_33195, partial [Myxococcales bacterium]|nr:hypothetical protein [Myxococcales bacterium]